MLTLLLKACSLCQAEELLHRRRSRGLSPSLGSPPVQQRLLERAVTELLQVWDQVLLSAVQESGWQER